MSEEIGYDGNHLSTTEDAFDQFQSSAAAAVEESDEFITLSDIVPPQPSIPNLDDELNEIPYDNEVILASTSNEEAHRVNNERNSNHNSEFDSELLDISGGSSSGQNYSENGSQNLQNEGIPVEIYNTNGMQRNVDAIQNRTYNDDSLDMNEYDIGGQDSIMEDNPEVIQDSILSTTVGKNDSEYGQSDSKSNLRRTRRGRIPNSSKYPLMTQNDMNKILTPGKRRGRPPKKIRVDSQAEPDSTNSRENSSFDYLNRTNNGNTQKSTKRGGRSRKSNLQSKDDLNNSKIVDRDVSEPLHGNKKRGRTKKSKSATTSSSFNNESKMNDEVDIIDMNSTKSEAVSKPSVNKKTKGKISKLKKAKEITKIENNTSVDVDVDEDEDADDMSLSKLKEITSEDKPASAQDKSIPVLVENQEVSQEIEIESESFVEIEVDAPQKPTEGPPETEVEMSLHQEKQNELLVEDTTKRNRRSAKKTFHYDEGSDEDPFANIESSEDESPRRRKKGTKYYSDDEYVPEGGRVKGYVASSNTDSEINDADDGDRRKLKRKKIRKKSDAQSPRKKGKISNTNSQSISENETNSKMDNDIEICLEPSVIPVSDDYKLKPPAEAWATSNEFENFIAQKIQGTSTKIKKVSNSKRHTENSVPPITIPVLDPVEAKKTVENSSQTDSRKTTSIGLQTSAPYDIPMKNNKELTSEQSEKACAFLKSVVKTTSELGSLMTEKSEDFMKKKINTENMTDTFKMDYCVRKSFLLFKLAKHNLMQMEEDLAKQYDEFLKSHGLSSCRDEIKKIAPKIKEENDSDCEIVDEVPAVPKKEKEEKKPKFNAKTVFLNKELSIKIAKKPTAVSADNTKQIDIKSRHAVWINDSVMVKKVKPNQSFLAQDSRNKKPPDQYVTEDMVSDFFKEYYRQKAITMCAPFVSTEWTQNRTEYACHYFLNCEEFNGCNGPSDSTITNETANTTNEVENVTEKTISNPKSLLTLCTDIIHLYLNFNNNVRNGMTVGFKSDISDKNGIVNPISLSRICLKALSCLYLNPQPALANEPYSSAHVIELPEESLSMTFSPEPIDDTSEEIITSEFSLSFSPNKLLLPNEAKIMLQTAAPLKTLCYRKIAQYFTSDNIYSHDNYACSEDYEYSLMMSPNDIDKVEIKSLFSICVKAIQSIQQPKVKRIYVSNLHKPISHSPQPLMSLAFNVAKYLNYSGNIEDFSKEQGQFNIIDEIDEEQVESDEADEVDNFTINCVNTLTDEAFQNLEEPECEESAEYSDDLDYGIENDMDDNTEWVSQLQVQELRSCATPTSNVVESNLEQESHETVIDRNLEHEHHDGVQNLEMSARIKLEPIDDFAENIVDPPIIKTEPCHGFNEMTIIPESIVTKKELLENVDDKLPDPEASSAFDVNAFEHFVSHNKMMYHAMSEYSTDEIFSQSALRIRRQHEPDFEEENDSAMSLLEPLHVERAKGILMESSSDGENADSRKAGRKKIDKRKKKNQKAKEAKNNKNDNKIKDVPLPTKEKPNNSEVATLTRRMRDKIRQEEKKVESSESESENLPVNLRKDKKERDKLKNKKQTELDEIQCNNVDSTEKLTGDLVNADDDDGESFAGFSPVDQNEVENFQKHMRKAFETLVPEKPDKPKKRSRKKIERIPTPVIEYDEPAEEIECEPTLPMLDDTFEEQKKPRTIEKITKTKEHNIEITRTPEQPNTSNEPVYIDRHGWHCYPITADLKLFQSVKIYLEKLPETFVETYLEYQQITDKDKEDEEVDRLINLQSLNRGTIKDGKQKTRPRATTGEQSEQVTNEDCESSTKGSRTPSPTYSDNYAELTPSEDEDINMEDEVPPAVPLRSTENVLAKNSLMDDHDSEDENGTKKIKEELRDNFEIKVKPGSKSKKPNILRNNFEIKVKPGPKSKKPNILRNSKVNSIVEKDLMLTADKMMNKELIMLHAPVMLPEDQTEIKVEEGTSTKPTPPKEGKTRQKTTRISTGREHKNDDDSSSEEEKQWVNTKEKLLKKLGRKEDATADDAKRTKLVTDFIEKRNDMENRKKVRPGRKMSRKKMLEREKQLRVLSKELFGESSIDATHSGKKGAPSLFKGRRNIRAVIDKKSLARSTVLANMEEFERKRRLTIRQNQLRELLGCEEGVNVLVINDEVCLEYDFDEHQPVVSVHRFFTSVMKAHQYEGVKFMWDACFESIKHVEEGHPGGGCILAHCMGLGKTLQVLALLHTVLTHPRVGMHRVLVCCPLSTVLNWVDEIHKWLGPVTNKIKVFELSKLRKTYERAYQLEDWYNGGGIFIIGYELFRSLTTLDPLIDDVRPSILKKIRSALLDPGPDIIICDEGHLLKNDCSVLAVAMSRVVTKRRIVLTGTPMQNNLREYYCMVNFIKPNLLGTYSEYSNRFENPIMNGQHRDSREEDIRLMKARTHILHKVLEGCLQRQEASVLYPYLPKKHEYTVFIPLTKCQWDLYKHYIENYTNQNLNKNKPNVLKDFHILQKIWSHPQVLHNFQTKKRDHKVEKLEDDLALEDKEDIKPPETETWWLQYLNGGTMLDCVESSNKFVAVFKILQECVQLGDKVLIFSTSLSCLDALEYFLKRINDWNLGHDYYRLDGSVPAEVRQKWCREFNADNNVKTKLFLISTRAGCLGLNMTAANRVIILDTSWNPAHDIQSIFRVYRFGQKKDCYIYRLVAMGTMEQKIYERSVTKQAVACRVVDEQQIDRHYNMADLNELYRYDESGSQVAGGVAVGVCDVALLRVARDAALHAVHEHDSLLRGGAEPALPEHEREHAWRQFQQEHAHKQMQNDLDQRNLQIAADRAAALCASPRFPPPPPLGVPPPFSVIPRRGRPPNATATASGNNTARVAPDLDDDIVHQISNILLKHDATKFMDRPDELSRLVARVRSLVEAGGSPSLDSDDLTASIAAVMLRDVNAAVPPPPPLTNVAPTLPDSRRGRGRPRKEPIEPPKLPSPPPLDRHLPSHRALRKRKAALVAETRFESSATGAHDDIIDLDSEEESPPGAPADADEDWLDPEPDVDHNSDSGAGVVLSVDQHAPAVEVKPEPPPVPAPVVARPRPGPLSRKMRHSDRAGRMLATPPPPDDASILLSDDETTAPPAPRQVDDDEVPLHPSLLANQNFLKIVAHTYLAGNPMLTEDAAVLAAQYSILKTLREAEASGKNIVDGPVYDIAVKVLGKSVIKKVFEANPKTKDLCAEKSLAAWLQSGLGSVSKPNSDISTLAQAAGALLEPKKEQTTTASKKPKIGPKSKTKKLEPAKSPVPSRAPSPQPQSVPKPTKIVPFKIVNNRIQMTSCPATAADECILPDDTDEEPVPASAGPTRSMLKHTTSRMFNTNPTPIKIIPRPTPENIPGKQVQMQPAPVSICLDSDEEDSSMGEATPAPVPIALTGPNSQALPLSFLSRAPPPIPPPPPPVRPPPPPPPPAQSRALRQSQPQIVRVARPQQPQPTRPVPVTLSGPGSQPIPASVPNSIGSTNPMTSFASSSYVQPVPVSLSGPNAQQIVFAQSQSDSSGPQLIPISMIGSDSNLTQRPTIQTSVFRTHSGGMLTLQLDPSKLTTQSSPSASNIILMPNQKKYKRLEKSDVPQNIIRIGSGITSTATLPPPVPSPAPAPAPAPAPLLTPATIGGKRTYCKPGDIFRVSKTGELEVIERLEQASPTSSQPPPHKAPPKTAPKPPPILPTKSNDTLNETSPSVSGRERRASSSSRSSRSSSPEADDPLAILKNVVHIQAPPKQTKSIKPIAAPAKPTPPPTPPAPTPTPTAPAKTPTSYNRTPSFSAADKKSLFDKLKSIGNQSSVTKTSNTTLTTSQTKTHPKKSTGKDNAKTTKTKAKSSKEKPTFTSIDLTDMPIPSTTSTRQSAPNRKLITLSSEPTLATKNISIDGKNKTVVNMVDLTSQTKTKTPAPSTTKVKTEPKPKVIDKRPAPKTEPAPAKKKKTELMTLKDFDIDDIDDIIELD